MSVYLYVIHPYLEQDALESALKSLNSLCVIKQQAVKSNACKTILLFRIDIDELCLARSLLDEIGCDFIINDEFIKIPKLIVFDMDSTLIPIEVIDELARFAGKEKEVSAITERAMLGELDFNQSLLHRVNFLQGLSVSVINTLADSLSFNLGVESFCNYMNTHGATLAIASGGFMPLAEKLQTKIPFRFIKANQLATENNKLTGKLDGLIINAEQKALALEAWRKELDICWSETMAIGDGANDLQMLKKAGLGLAYHAKPKVNQSAQAVLKYTEMDVLIDFFEFAKEITTEN